LEVSGQTQAALRLVGALWQFWYTKGYVLESRRRLDRAIGADEQPTVARAKALSGAVAMALEAADVPFARVRAEEALAIYRHLDHPWGIANALLLLGHAVADGEDFTRAQQLFDESLQRFRDIGDEHYVLLLTRLLAWPTAELGERDRARALYEEVVDGARRVGNERMEAMALGALAEYAVDDGRLKEAGSMLRVSTRVWHDIGELSELALNLCRIALLLAVEGRPEVAAVTLARAEATLAEAGIGMRPWLAKMNDRTRTLIGQQLDEATLTERAEYGRRLPLDDAVALAIEPLD
jgi:tetratricopeptide (TPR) repeat protein